MPVKTDFIFIVLLSFLILSVGINLPFAGQHDWNTVMYANIARNHLRYGILQTKLGMVTNFGPLLPGESFGYFTHYPPLMPLLVALSFALFGIHHWSARLVPIISCALLVGFIYKICYKLWGRYTALIAVVVTVLSPILLYYSKIPVHETVSLGFIGFTIYNYIIWITTSKSRNYWFTVAGLIVSQLTSWSGFYLSAYLPLHYYATRRHASHWRPLTLLLIAPVIFIAHNLHMYLLVGNKAQTSLLQGLLFRLNIGTEAQKYQITLSKFLTLQASWIVLYFTRIVVVFSFVWLVKTLFELLKTHKMSLANSTTILLGVFGFTHNLVFRNLAYIHDYMLIYALPFFAISASVSLTSFWKWLKQRLPLASVVIIIILFLFATERIGYVKALLKSGSGNQAVTLGKTINRISQPNDIILIASTNFMQYLDVFVRYYADRHVTAADEINPTVLQDVHYVVIPKNYDTLSLKSKQYLYSNYIPQTTLDGIVFNTTRQP